MASALDQLYPCTWNDLKFYYYGTKETFKRNVVVHQYLGGLNPWCEDMGNGVQQVQIDGFINNQDWIVWERAGQLVDNVLTFVGIGELWHPVYGLKKATCIGVGLSTSVKSGTSIPINFTFIIYTDSQVKSTDDTQSQLTDSSTDSSDTSIDDYSTSGEDLSSTTSTPSFLSQVGQALSDASTAIMNGLSDVADFISEGVSDLSDYISEGMSDAADFVNQVVSGVSDVADFVDNTINDVVDTVVQPIESVLSNADEFILDSAAPVASLVLGVIGVVTSASRIANSVVGIADELTGNNVQVSRYYISNTSNGTNQWMTQTNHNLSPNPLIAQAVSLGIAGANLSSQTAINSSAQIIRQLQNVALYPSQTYLSTFAGQISGAVEYTRQAFQEPEDQIQALLTLSSQVKQNTRTGHLIRVQVLASVALAVSNYNPTSSTDANNLLNQVTPYFQQEIMVANFYGYTQSVRSINNLKIKFTNDLMTRGAALPSITNITLPSSLPARVIAYRLYQDETRGTELVLRNKVSNPIFMPTNIEILSS
jgi:prophage DNA circulation protein